MATSISKIKTATGARNTVTSKDGKWHSFPKVPNLLRYISSGAYFARVKVKGKIIRRSLGTNVWSTAKLRLLDFLSGKRRDDDGSIPAPLFSEATDAFKTQLGRNPTMKESSKHYRLICLRKIELSWLDSGLFVWIKSQAMLV